MNRKAKEEKSGKRKIEGGREWDESDCTRVCFGFCSSLLGNAREKSGGAASFREAGDCVSDCGLLSVCSCQCFRLDCVFLSREQYFFRFVSDLLVKLLCVADPILL